MSTHSITYCDVCGSVRHDTSKAKRGPVGRLFIDMTSADGQTVKREQWDDLCRKCHAKALGAVRKALGKGTRREF